MIQLFRDALKSIIMRADLADAAFFAVIAIMIMLIFTCI